MFWLPLSLCFVLLSLWVVDWRRVREYLPVALAGIMYSNMHTALPRPLRPIEAMVDIGPITSNWGLVLVSQMLINPVCAIWFAQGLKPGSRFPLGRTAAFTAIGFAIQIAAYLFGRILYAKWWHPALALVDGPLFCSLIWFVHHYVNAHGWPRRARGDRSAPLR
jgi:hypothetical protein